jgi:polysaccharide biosynthesis transport protein
MRRVSEIDGHALPETTGGASQNRYAGAAEVSEYLNLGDYLRILKKRRHILIAFVAMGLAAAFGYNSVATPLFESRSTVQIDTDPNILALDRPLVDQRDWAREYIPTQIAVIQSRQLARAAHEQLKASAAAGAGTPDETAVAAANGDSSQAANIRVPSVGEIMGGRNVTEVRDTRLIRIAFQSSDPETAARVANALAQAYVQQNLSYKTSATGEASDWLTQQVAQQRTLVEESEAALQRYREQHGADALFADREGTERQNIVVQKLADLQGQVTQAKAATIDKEAAYRQLLAVQGNREALETLPVIAANAYIQAQKTELSTLRRQLQQASQELGELHPERIKLEGAVRDADRKLQIEISNVVQAMKNELAAARSAERALVGALERQKAEVQALNAKAVEYTGLEREASSNRQVLDKLLQRSSEAALARQLQTTNTRIVDPAVVPDLPVFPRKERNIALALTGSGGLALGLVFLLEIFDRRVSSPDDVRRHLRVSVLGVAPEVKADSHASLLLSDGPPPQFAELLHGLRTNLVLAPELAAKNTVLVTSSEPGEGKTMTAANVAVSLARLNQRVLLIDADLRKPRLHEVFGVERRPGLSDVLTAGATHEAFWKTKVEGLWLMPAGSSCRNPADLLGTERFETVIEGLRTQFDWIVLDSPPVLAVTDPCLLARVAAGVLFVVGSGRTSRSLAAAAVERLESAGASVLGVMLNRAVLDGDESYLPYYHREYATYYPAPQGRAWQAELPEAASKS